MNFRHPQAHEIDLVYDLIVRCETAEYGEPDIDLVELQHDWDGADLERDVWLALSSTGDLVGYAAVIDRGSDLQYDFFTEPAITGSSLGTDLLERLEQSSLALLLDRQGPEEILAVSYIAHVNQRDQLDLQQAGFLLAKYHFQMQAQLDGPVSDPQWPEGISVRTTVPEQDDHEVYLLIQKAFARPGRQAQPFAEWRAAMMRDDIFVPELWFLAPAENELVGACLCYEYAELGWVRQLGVKTEWRRRGLGAALLQHSFVEFKRRGFGKVGLGVEAANPDAYAFYQRLGMRRARQYDEYHKIIKLRH